MTGQRWVRRFLGAAVVLCLGVTVVPASAARASDLHAVPMRIIGGSAHAGLYGWGAATMLDGSVLIGDYWNLRVMHYAKDGTDLGSFISPSAPVKDRSFTPYGIAVDPTDGSVYVSDTNNWVIHKYDAAGNYLLTFGVHGTGPTQFQYPSRLTVAGNGDVYVADAWANDIKVFDSAGNWLFDFGTFGVGPGQMKMPHGIEFDTTGRLWVVDTNNYRVDVFSATGTFLFSFGSKGPAGGQFSGELRGLAIDLVHGWAYVVDSSRFISKFDMNGTFLLRFGQLGSGDGQFSAGGREDTVDGDGNIWVGDMPDYRAEKFDPNGNFLLSVPETPAPPAPGGFNGPRAIAFDAQGDSFVVDTYNQRIEKFDPNGNFLLQWGGRGRGDSGFNYPRGITVDQTTGDVIVADTDNNKIKRYDNNGNFLWQVGGYGSKPGQLFGPYGVDLAPNGDIVVADSNNTRVVVLDPNGNYLYSFGSKGSAPGQFKWLRGIDVGPDGTIWTADQMKCQVQHFSATGTLLGVFGGCGSAAKELRQPYGIEVTASYVFVSDSGINGVKVFTLDGAYVTTIGARGTAIGQLLLPKGIDIGPDGGLYVVEQGNDRVTEFTLTTTAHVTSTTLVAPTSAATGAAVTLTATVGPTPDGGTMRFRDGGAGIAGCTAQPVSTTDGVATCVTQFTAGGVHSVVATYSGDAGFASSISSPAVMTIRVATATVVGSSASSTNVGTPITLTADVSPVPDGGTVTWSDGGVAIVGCKFYKVDPVLGHAQCTARLSTSGWHSVTAGYSGDADFAPSTSKPTVIAVG